MSEKPIYIGNDQGGFELKRRVCEHLEKRGIPFRNMGCDTEEMVRYPHYAAKVAGAVSRGETDRGILICSTGIGMSIIANKYKGVRASLCTSSYMGKITRGHNDSNVLCLGGRITGFLEALDIVDLWLDAPYDGGRHDVALGLIREAEESLCTGLPWPPAEK